MSKNVGDRGQLQNSTILLKEEHNTKGVCRNSKIFAILYTCMLSFVILRLFTLFLESAQIY